MTGLYSRSQKEGKFESKEKANELKVELHYKMPVNVPVNNQQGCPVTENAPNQARVSVTTPQCIVQARWGMNQLLCTATGTVSSTSIGASNKKRRV